MFERIAEQQERKLVKYGIETEEQGFLCNYYKHDCTSPFKFTRDSSAHSVQVIVPRLAPRQVEAATEGKFQDMLEGMESLEPDLRDTI